MTGATYRRAFIYTAPVLLPFDVVTTPTPLQQRAFDLLKVNYRM
jgi:hypothetical protein